MIRVAITTSSLRLSQALHALLSERGRFEVITAGASHDEFRARDSEIGSAADVVLTDLPGRSIDDVVAPPVLLADEEDLLANLRPLRGGLALLPTSASADQLVAAIEATAAGLAVLHPDHAGSFSVRPSDDPLTPREREVLHLLAAGL